MFKVYLFTLVVVASLPLAIVAHRKDSLLEGVGFSRFDGTSELLEMQDHLVVALVISFDSLLFQNECFVQEIV